MKEEDIYELIERYQKGQLEGKERADFEFRLKSDQGLQHKLEVYKATNKLVIQNRLREVKGLLEAEKVIIKSDSSGSAAKYLLGLLIVAVILGIFFISNGKVESSETTIVPKIQKEEEVQRVKDKIGDELKTVSNKEVSPITIVKARKKDSVTTNSTKKESDVREIGQNIDKDTIKPVIQEKAVKEVFTKSTGKDSNQRTEKVMINKPEPCAEVSIIVKPEVKDACFGEKNGEIILSKVRGGVAPYSFILNDTEEVSSGVFLNLAPGTYKIEITDHTGCKKILKDITLSGRTCRKNLHFSPFRGEQLELPVYEKSGTLSIFDKMGNIYYTKKISANEQFTWDGQSSSGELKAGYFLFIIQYGDGVVQEGSITIAP